MNRDDNINMIPDFLKRLNFPKNKQEIVEFLIKNRASNSIINAFTMIKNKTYNGYDELKKEAVISFKDLKEDFQKGKKNIGDLL